MLDFIVNNYYVILVVCILCIFAIIGYIIDTLKKRKYEESSFETNTYIPEEEIFIKNFESEKEEEKDINNSVDELLKNYNNYENNENS